MVIRFLSGVSAKRERERQGECGIVLFLSCLFPPAARLLRANYIDGVVTSHTR